uniref:Protein kinase domain-containing protein n=1 Tax=Macrostomum lignano TaxID=282301 RepID=A0A1I8JNY6_9PLAT
GYASALMAFDAVRQACFGQQLMSDFCQKIAQLESCCAELKLVPTPKMHALFHHVPEFCERFNSGLGTFSYGLEVDMWALGVIAYILLFLWRLPPRSAEVGTRRQSELLQMIKTGTFEYLLSPYWDHIVSRPISSTRLLVVDKAARLTAIDVLCHAWVLSRGGSQRQEQEQQTDSAALKDEQSRLRDQLVAEAAAAIEEFSKIEASSLYGGGMQTAARFTPEQPDGPDFSPQSGGAGGLPRRPVCRGGLLLRSSARDFRPPPGPPLPTSRCSRLRWRPGRAAAYFAAHHGFGAARPDGCLVPLPSGNKKLRRLRKPRTIYSSLQLQQLSRRFQRTPVPVIA